MVVKKPNLKQYAKMPNPGLINFLRTNRDGNIVDIRTPLFNKRPRSEVLSELLKLIEDNKHTLTLELYEYEKLQASNVGRYSAMFPFNMRRSDVNNYFVGSRFYNIDPIIATSLNEFQRRNSQFKGSIRNSSVVKAMNSIPHNTNSGLPDFTKRSRVLFDSLNRVDDMLYKGYDLKKVINRYSCILGWRGQPVDKQRVVWMYPLDLNIIESMYYKPLISQIQKTMTKPEFISSYEVEKRITSLFDTRENIHQIVIATDFDKFDANFNSLLQELSFKMKMYRSAPELINFTEDVHYTKYNIPLICTENIMFEGHHGMASGSSGTNIDETESHSVMQVCAAVNSMSKLNPYSTTLGDDGVLTFEGISTEGVVSTYSNIFGQTVNEDKQYVSDVATRYLQRLYHVGYRDDEGTIYGVYPIVRALGRLLGQERFIDPSEWGPDMVALRSMSIIENCNRHPLFDKFVNFVITNDKYQLGIKIPGFLEKLGKMDLRGLFNKVGKTGLSYTRILENEYNPNIGIRTWRVYKRLVELAKH